MIEQTAQQLLNEISKEEREKESHFNKSVLDIDFIPIEILKDLTPKQIRLIEEEIKVFKELKQTDNNITKILKVLI